MLRLAKVVKVHPEAYAVDLVFTDTNSRANGIKVMGWNASTNTGRMSIPTPTPPAEPYDIQDTRERDAYAVVAFAKSIPVVMGWLYPEGGQMTFEQPGREIDRHESDWYTSIDAEGNFEAYHPSGTMIRIGTAPEHEDLTGLDLNKKWAITKNLDKEVHLNIVVAAAGVQKAKVHITPTGDITIEGAKLDVTTTGETSFTASAFEFTGPATFVSPATFNENVQVDKTLTATTDVVGGGKSLKLHKHGGVSTGGAQTTAPV